MRTAIPEHVIRHVIRRALQEDVGRGDLTTSAVVPPGARIRAHVRAKAPGIVAGATVARRVFETVDRRIRCTVKRGDGQEIRAGQVVLALHGPAHSILTAERTALNFLGHLSGVATLTRAFVQRVPKTVRILDTRKTLPGLRFLEKHAVRVGGGAHHRWGLDDAILIKTNHLRAISTQHTAHRTKLIQHALKKARQRARGRTVEIEVTNLREFMAALQAKPDVILLDNWALGDIRKAVLMRNHAPRPTPHTPLLEVSGGVTLDNIHAIAKTGVERISIGRLTHSAPALDVSLTIA